VREWANIAAILALLFVALVACTTDAPPSAEALPSPVEVLPGDGAVEGWSRTQEPQTYDPETLFDFMNGAADLYFTFGFQSLAVARYERDGVQAQVEVYWTTTDADAFGLYAYNAYGDPVELGVDGRLSSGQGLAFWQRRTFVQILASGDGDDDALRALGEAIAAALPDGGERPQLAEALPEEGLQPGSVGFFREQVALDNYIWLGSENVLNLGPEVAGVLGEYALDGENARLILVAYRDEGASDAALAALQQAALTDLVVAERSGSVLGAVFGDVADDRGAALLDQALEGVR
jgi:hypothetical protein